jgi:phosphonate transport system substrate-binding protein
MSDSISPQPQSSFSLGRVLLLAVPLGLVVWGAKVYSNNAQQEAEARVQRNSFVGLFGSQPESTSLDKSAYQDADGDLLADAPAADKCIDPERIAFSYVASHEPEGEQRWRELIAALEAKLGRPVTLVSYGDTNEQLRALKAGELHVTAFSTGEAPSAVNDAGFIPLACGANDAGDYGITMKIIVPAASAIKEIGDLKPTGANEELKRHNIKFVRPRSNTGCTAAVVMLKDEHDLQPDRDYTWGFSYGHEESIAGVAAGRFEAAAVASDILARMIASDAIDETSIRTIYESAEFPPVVFGCAYNLKPELRAAVRDALLEFAWAGTGVEQAFGPSGAVKFVEVSYQDDWKPVRDVRESVAKMLAQLATP